MWVFSKKYNRVVPARSVAAAMRILRDNRKAEGVPAVHDPATFHSTDRHMNLQQLIERHCFDGCRDMPRYNVKDLRKPANARKLRTKLALRHGEQRRGW